MRTSSSKIALVGIPLPYLFTRDSNVDPPPYIFRSLGCREAVKNLGSLYHALSIVLAKVCEKAAVWNSRRDDLRVLDISDLEIPVIAAIPEMLMRLASLIC